MYCGIGRDKSNKDCEKPYKHPATSPLTVGKQVEKQADKKRKGDWMVTITSTVTKKETYLIENETKEDAEYIATDQNCSPRFKCTLWNSTESDVEEEEVVSKEVSFSVVIRPSEVMTFLIL